MELLRKLNDQANKPKIESIKEDVGAGAATGAGAIAMFALPLLSKVNKRTLPTPSKKTSKKRLSEDLSSQNSPDVTTTDSDSETILSKLRDLERKEKTDHRDTTVFGLEDNDGGTAKITIGNEQAEDFQKAIQNLLADEEDMDIAEAIFKLKDKFNILNIDYPDIEEDEEEQQDVAPPEGIEPPIDQDASSDMSDIPQGDDTQNLLMQVIDMMKTDAEARKAEAEARQAEAKSREADMVMQQNVTRVKQEEQMLDMETAEKSRKEADRESKRLAKLAKWKSEVESGQDGDMDDTGGTFTGDEEEEENYIHYTKSKPLPKPLPRATRKVLPVDIANFILKRVK